MEALEVTVRLVSGVALMLANAFFVSVEFAMTRLRQFPSESIDDDSGLERAWKMTEKLEIYLTGCQLGISVTSILLGVIAEPAITYLFKPFFELIGVPDAQVATVSVVIAVVFMNLAHKIWGEQAPTYLGVERPLEVARALAPILYWWTKITYPFIYLGDGLAKSTLRLFGVEVTRSWTEGDEGEDEVEIQSRSQLKRKINEILGQGEMSEERRREVVNALEIGERYVADIMIARDDVTTIDVSVTPERLLESLGEHEFVRYPVVDDGEPVGILYSPGVFKHVQRLRDGEMSVRELASDAVTVADDLPISEFVDRLQEVKQEAAFVCRDGDWIGFATVTDAFEDVLGDLEDPFD
ncbi:MAG: CNNM domain-containing protein [Myxococcota bacterium]